MKILYLPNQYSQQRQREKKRWIYPVLMAMEAEWYRQQGNEVVWLEDGDITDYQTIKSAIMGKSSIYDKIIEKPENLSFLSLPYADRMFTDAFNKRYQYNGNFKYHPGTYIQAANGCWHGKCTFCVEQNKPWEVRSVESVIEEIQECKALGFKEVFDDSGTFPTGYWLYLFCNKLSKLHGLRFSCNLRMVDVDYRLLRNAGFRMVLFGLESANQNTLDRIQKHTRVEDVKYIIKAARAGLEPHIAVMFGYPWESDSDAINTLRLVWWLLRKGYAKTAQASFYDSSVPSNEGQRKYVKQIYRAAYFPSFWLNKLRDIHNMADLKYFWRQIKEGVSNV